MPTHDPVVSKRKQRPYRAGAPATFLTPAMLVILAFTVLPMLLTLWISFHRWSMFTPITQMDWVGLDNYRAAMSGSHLAAFRNTAVYVSLSLVVSLPLAFFVSLLLFFPRIRGKGVVRVLLFSTYVVPTIAVVITWGSLFAPGYGALDTLLGYVGIDAPSWLSDPDWALFSLVIFNVWQMLGYYVILMVAGLTQIPQELFEAARIDGAGVMHIGRHIIIPLLKGTSAFVALMTVINSIQVFDPIYLLTQGGPIDSTNVLSYDIQRTAFSYGLAGEASAVAVCMFVSVIVILLAVSRAIVRRP
jgi:multiple sugar transport system permease protein